MPGWACLQVYQTGVTATPGRGELGPARGGGRFRAGIQALYLRQLGAHEGVEGSLEQVERTHAWSRG